MDKQTSTSDTGITGGVKTISYTVSDEGRYELVSGPGWQPVNIVNRQAWMEIERHITSAQKKVTSGRASCLHYYMIANQMTIGLLAGYTNQSRLRVRLHLMPFFFKRLGLKTLEKYADLFQVAINDLKSGALKAPVYDSTQHGRQRHD